MRQRQMLLSTLREAPAEAEAASHRLLLRGGYVRQTAAGIYSFLPLGFRVLRKLERIIREEMQAAGFDELLMPAMQPSELWEQSGRHTEYGPELIRLQDRHQRGVVLGPTHEEVVTSLAAAEVSSYRQLPLRLYQIQTKFRDERRPRHGLLRGREFLMKDAYSFDTDWQGLDENYQAVVRAYHRIFERCGLRFRAVEAEAGAIGGEGETLEFMALADIGEDTVVTCPSCDYAANLEKAVFLQEERGSGDGDSVSEPEEVHTPGIKTIGELSAFLGERTETCLKTMIYTADGQPIAVVVRGDHEVNEFKLKNELGADRLELADLETVERVTGAPHGFAGPKGLHIPIYLDSAAAAAAVKGSTAGANRKDYHVRHLVPGRDFQAERIGDYRNAQTGDRCSRCGEELVFSRGIEVGHVFKLGTKYSKALGATFTNKDGQEDWMIMGCYGIGVSRLISAAAEQHGGESGIVWPLSLAPFQVHVIPVSAKDAAQTELGTALYEKLRSSGIDVLLDDRDERPGVKFKDADLIGAPLRIVVGKAAAEGLVEWQNRRDGDEKELIAAEEAALRVAEICSSGNG
ncbi:MULTISPECIES: proline--tRNA ligase [Paenibacillus]|uniref:Proline--tRNA ligase n=1 Tax=Paenibacillus albilobatus TaxID=2716884 RepID=A0A920CA23_9BACL|nr:MULTISPECIES: proline--tRNA ligase [Paenibacillus]GIO29694.1 proline--tRNA ligase [Paenibacillus albilobatus]